VPLIVLWHVALYNKCVLIEYGAEIMWWELLVCLLAGILSLLAWRVCILAWVCDCVFVNSMVYFISVLYLCLGQGGYQARPWIGLDHINRSKGPRAAYLEKAIKIHNWFSTNSSRLQWMQLSLLVGLCWGSPWHVNHLPLSASQSLSLSWHTVIILVIILFISSQRWLVTNTS